MSQDIQIFNFRNNNIRAKNIEDNIYFCATDVCNILELGNTAQALNRIDSGCIISNDIPHPQSVSKILQVAFVNEAGLYELIFCSKKEKAKDFKKWVFNDVLPQIRKTGKYEIQKNQMQLPANYIEALEALVISKKSEARLLAENQQVLIENEEKQNRLNSQDKTIDKITNEKDLYGLREVAKKIQINERVLIGKLYQMGWIYTLANKQTASSKACSGGYMKNVNVFSKTNDKYYIQAQITEKGLNYLIKNNS